VDVVGKRLREQQQQDRFKAAQSFIERTTCQKLPSSDLHESLKDGVILCEYDSSFESRVHLLGETCCFSILTSLVQCIRRLANQLSPKIVRLISRKEFPFLQVRKTFFAGLNENTATTNSHPKSGTTSTTTNRSKKTNTSLPTTATA